GQQAIELSSEKERLPGLRPTRLSPPAYRFLLFFIAVWLLLYSSSTTDAVLAVGVIASGLFLLLGIIRSFQAVRPLDGRERTIIGRVMQFGLKMFESLGSVDKIYKTRAEAIFDLKKCVWVGKLFRTFAVFLRGRRGQGRVSFIVLVHYVVSLV